MSSLRRHKRRQQGHQALNQLTSALTQLQGLQGLQQGMESLQGLDKMLRDTHALVNALIEDYEKLDAEVTLQREVFIRLITQLTDHPDEFVRGKEGQIRAKVLAQTTQE